MGRARNHRGAKSISEGMLQAFDPDYIVLTGTYSQSTVDIGHRKAIHSSEILQGVEIDGTPKYGIGLFEPLQYFAQKELKFVRREPLAIRLPEFGRCCIQASSGCLVILARLTQSFARELRC